MKTSTIPNLKFFPAVDWVMIAPAEKSSDHPNEVWVEITEGNGTFHRIRIDKNLQVTDTIS